MTANVADPNWLDSKVINDEVQGYTPWIDIHELESFTVFIETTETNTAGTLTITLQVSMDAVADLNKSPTPPVGKTLSSGVYDKLITDAGVDAPVGSITFTATGFDVFSISSEDSIRSVRLGYISGATTDSTDYWTVQAGYSGRAK
jgi:hypothetical protein